MLRERADVDGVALLTSSLVDIKVTPWMCVLCSIAMRDHHYYRQDSACTVLVLMEQLCNSLSSLPEPSSHGSKGSMCALRSIAVRGGLPLHSKWHRLGLCAIRVASVQVLVLGTPKPYAPLGQCLDDCVWVRVVADR